MISPRLLSICGVSSGEGGGGGGGTVRCETEIRDDKGQKKKKKNWGGRISGCVSKF